MGVCVHKWSVVGPWGGKVQAGCQAPLEMVCKVCQERRRIACGTSRASRCEPCSIVYRQRVARVAGSGLRLGRAGLFATVTAPGMAAHHLRSGDVCRCTPEGGVDLAAWNATAGARFNRFIRDLSRFVKADIVTVDDDGVRRVECGLIYFKGAEVQRRGALHFHLMLARRDGAPLAILLTDFRALAVAHGFGHSVDVQPLTPAHAVYVAKYVSKAANERRDVPWSREGWARPANPDHRVVKVAARDVHGKRVERSVIDRRTGELVGPAVRALFTAARYRTWSASRRWGDSMASVKAAQQHWVLLTLTLPAWGETGAPPWWSDVAGLPDRPDASPVPG